MEIINLLELQNLSFPDCQILKMFIDMNNKIAEIYTNSGYINLRGGINLLNCQIILKNWASIDIALYNSKTKIWEKLNSSNIDYLDDICEFNFGELIIFKGFGKRSGQWIEYSFKNPEYQINCEK